MALANFEYINPSPTLFIVTGCPRSGTTFLIEQIKEHLKVPVLGYDDLGLHREWKTAIAANSILLGDIFADLKPEIPNNVNMEKQFEEFKEFLISSKDEFSEHPMYFFKDPRICYTWPFWMRLFEIRIIHIVRKFEGVFNSIDQVDNVGGKEVRFRWIKPKNQWKIIWENHVNKARESNEYLPYLEIPFESFIENPKPWIEKIANFVKAPEKCLNLGSGLAPKAGEEWVNLDYNADYIPPAKYGVNGVVADLESPLPFKDNTFSFILANHILEHIKNYEQLMCEIYRVLKIGGRLIIRVPYAFCRAAIADPSHVRQFVPESFFHFLPDNIGPVANRKFWGTFKLIDLEIIKHDRPGIDRGEVGSFFTEIYCELEKIPKQEPPKPKWIERDDEQRQGNNI